MIGLLARVIIGVAAVGAVGGTAYGVYNVYKLITRETAKKEIISQIEKNDDFKNFFKAKCMQKKNEAININAMDEWDEPLKDDEAIIFTVMDKWDNPIGDVVLYGDEISSDIEIGDEIILC